MLGNKNSWWAFKEVLSSKFCNEVIKHASNKKEGLGYTGGMEKLGPLNEEQKKNLFKTRNSKVAWLDDPWIHMHLMGYIAQANKEAGWNYEYSGVEHTQFTKYNTNQYYRWHKDEWDKSYEDLNNPRKHNKVRKLSAVVSLNTDYVGGDLQFQYRDAETPQNEICEIMRTPGSVVVFPSYVWHQVLPVTQGTRYSLVLWTVGEPWR